MNEGNGSQRSSLGLIFTLLLIVVLPLALGIYFGPRFVPTPKVGVIRLNYEIFDLSAFEFTEQMAYARQDSAIKAVVIIMNSPGGSAAYSEEMYLDVLETRKQIPVLASIDLLAASGAYYTAAGADEIYAKPTSIVGSIGVISAFPSQPFVDRELLTTGPYKAFGYSRDAALRQAEQAKFAFLEAVLNGRGDRLLVGPEFLSRAEVYTGIQALNMGLIDGLFSTEEVLDRAAELAGLRNYEVAELYPLAFPEETDEAQVVYRPEAIDPHRLWANPINLAPGLYFRFADLSR